MDKYFDAFLYVANWGTHILKLRLPDKQLSAKIARLYAVGEHAAVRVKNGNVIFSFHSDDENDEDSVESEGLLASMISVRSELAHGDLRALYLGWLLCAQSGELDPADLSPPVPPGLTKLSASLTSLAGFLRVDRALVRVAAKPATKSRTVADLMRDLEAASRKQSRAANVTPERGAAQPGRCSRVRAITACARHRWNWVVISQTAMSNMESVPFGSVIHRVVLNLSLKFTP